jgi:hypothetical protein
VTGSRIVDAATARRVDANTVNISSLKEGSPDGRTYPLTLTGTRTDGQRMNYVYLRSNSATRWNKQLREKQQSF